MTTLEITVPALRALNFAETLALQEQTSIHCHCRSVVMVPDPELAVNLTQEANEVISSLNAFQPELWGLPAFEAS